MQFYRFYVSIEDNPLSWPNVIEEGLSVSIVFDKEPKGFLPRKKCCYVSNSDKTCGHVEDSDKIVDLIKRMLT
jgi:hypothetical protein